MNPSASSCAFPRFFPQFLATVGLAWLILGLSGCAYRGHPHGSTNLEAAKALQLPDHKRVEQTIGRVRFWAISEVITTSKKEYRETRAAGDVLAQEKRGPWLYYVELIPGEAWLNDTSRVHLLQLRRCRFLR